MRTRRRAVLAVGARRIGTQRKPAEEAAMSAHWHSGAIPERDQFASWREACCQHVYAITPEREDHGGFRGSMQARRVGGLDAVDLQCEGHRVLRRAEDIRRAPSDTYYVYCQTGEAAWFLQEGRHVLALRGDIVLADPNVPFSTGASGDFDFRIWRLPRRRLDAYLAAPGRLPMIHLPFNSPECSLVASYLGAIAAQGERIDPRMADSVSDNLVRLVAATVGIAPEMRDAGRDAVRAAALQRVMRHAEAHLTDAGLTPASTAQALGMSVRKLHMLFVPTGQTFGEWMLGRRLEEARALLSSPATARRSITDIALTCGFNDLSTFYRAFRARWGVTPGEFRAGR
jgi:AraC-like DNA-binding protein